MNSVPGHFYETTRSWNYYLESPFQFSVGSISVLFVLQKGRSLILCVVVSAWAPIHQCLLAFEARWWGVSRLIIDQFWSTRSADKKRTLYFDKRSTWSRKSPLLCPLIFQTLLPVDFAPKSGSRVLIEPWEILSTCFVIFVEPEIYWNWSFTWWSSSWKILVTFVCVCLRIFFTEILLKIQTKKVLENPPTAADWTFFRTSKALFTIVTIYVKWMHHLNRFTCKKLVMYWRIFYAVDAKKSSLQMLSGGWTVCK